MNPLLTGQALREKGAMHMLVDYDRISERYDAHRRGGGPYLAKLVELARACRAERVLELGAGTGNNTAAFLDAYRCPMYALEHSAGMLARGRAKGLAAEWVRASAEAIPLAGGSVPFVFGVYILHHLGDPARMFRECARVIGQGCVAFVTASTSFIERHPMNRYFPSFAAVDNARFQPVDVLETALRQNGFAEAGSVHFADAPRPIDRAYVDRVAGKFISTLDLLPPGEYEAGLARLRTDVEQNGSLATPMVWESVVVWGRL